MSASAAFNGDQTSVEECSRLIPSSDENTTTAESSYTSRSRSIIIVLLLGITLIFGAFVTNVVRNGASASEESLESVDWKLTLDASVKNLKPDLTTKNATIVDGYLTINGERTYVGTRSSDINTVIQKYFPRSSYTQMTVNTRNTVWMNSTVALNYLTLVGNYTADVPIVLPHQFMLVMDNAALNAVENFPTNEKPINIGGVTIYGNPIPDSNILSITKTNWALIVINAVYNTGVISPGGPSKAYIGCRSMPYHGTADIIVGPAGIFTIGAGANYIDGIHVDNCGLNNGNIALYGTSRAEVTNCLVTDARTRGIWVIIMSFTVIHDTEIYGSMKFAIDLDANAIDNVVYNTYIHDNAYQAIFIEQGTQGSVVTDNDLPRNQNGVSFYNNLFAQLCADNVILSNKAYESTSAGYNVGSLNDDVIGFWPTTDSYLIGNIAYDNGRNVPQEKAKYGYSSNGPAHGIFFIANSDTQGQSQALWKFLKGGVVISDPARRMKVAAGYTPTMSPTARPTVAALPNKTPTRKPISLPTIAPSAAPSTPTEVSALNVTIKDGVITDIYGFPMFPLEVGTEVGTTTSALQAFVTKYFGDLLMGPASMIPWMWQPGVKQVISFLTLIGEYTADETLKLPRQLVLVLEGATITADHHLFSKSSLGIIVAEEAHFSHVVSLGGPSAATIDCGSVSGPAGIYIFNSSYFSVDGLTVKNCGEKFGAITMFGTSNHDVGNSTSIINSVISASAGHGIFGSRLVRPVLYQNTITNSAGNGIHFTGESLGPIISGNTLSKNVGDGVHTGEGTRRSVIRGNIISENEGSGISITNAKAKKSVTYSVVITNTITKNLKYSIFLGVDRSSTVVSTIIGGNKISSNAYGMFASDASGKGIQKTLLAANDDTDGLMGSFLSLTNGNSKDAAGNYFLDPMDRGVYYKPRSE